MREIADIVDAYRPRIKLHHKEGYFPVTIDFALSACELWKKDTKLLSLGEVNQKSLVEASNNLVDITDLSQNKDYYLKVVDNTKISGQKQILDTVPIYATVSKVEYTTPTGSVKYYLDISYNVLYLYNGPITLSSTLGIHNWDNEKVLIRVNPNVKPSIDAISYIYLSQHSTGVWLSPKNFKFDKTHPIIYSAKNSHAHYHTASYWTRLFATASDRTSDTGVYWKPDALYVDMSKPRTGKLIWTHYNGSMEKDGQPFTFFRKNVSVNTELRNRSDYDLISKKLGKKRSKFSLGLIIIPLLILIIGMAYKFLSLLTVFVTAPLFYSIYTGISLYNYIAIL